MLKSIKLTINKKNMEHLELTQQIIYWNTIPNRLDFRIAYCHGWAKKHEENGHEEDHKFYLNEFKKLVEIKKCIKLLKENLK
jgi:hypothetical protein